MLQRRLEPEVMETAQDAADYDAIDHREVNQRFVDDLRPQLTGDVELLDLGTGTAQIPILLCQACPQVRILAVDLAESMLELGRRNVAAAGLEQRVELQRIDCKRLPYRDGQFSGVISNSIVHHIPDPAKVLDEAVRVVAPGGLIFFRDLLRPADQQQLDGLVECYTVGSTARQRQLFDDSLHAALALDEIRSLVAALGFSPHTVAATSDRHWTWCARR
ncbi:MAG TPA: class I SAM-dependent methyltransferase [Pirellulales bacterium]|nr:class I SAM-dependent methyltransferase [Pirellulales bacterium]